MNLAMCIFAEMFVLLTTCFCLIFMDFLSYPKKKNNVLFKHICCFKYIEPLGFQHFQKILFSSLSFIA